MLVVNIFSWFIMKKGRSEIDMYGTTPRMKQKDDLHLVYNQKVKVDNFTDSRLLYLHHPLIS